MSRQRRVHHHPVPGPDGELVLDPEEAHHVRTVLRLAPGDAVSVFDGRGGEWDGIVTRAAPDEVRVRVGAARTDVVEPSLRVVLFQGLCRTERMEWVIQKGTEVGVHAFQPAVVQRCEDRPSAYRLERWRRIAREAAKQSGRRLVPEVREAALPPPTVPEGTLGLLLVPTEARPIGAALAQAAPEEVRLLVGPEGGLDPQEIALLVRGGWQTAGLGPRTLRTETAGVVAAALVLHAWGDLGRR